MLTVLPSNTLEWQWGTSVVMWYGKKFTTATKCRFLPFHCSSHMQEFDSSQRNDQ